MVLSRNSRSSARGKSPRSPFKSKSKSPRRVKPRTYRRNGNNYLGNNPLSAVAPNLLATPRSSSPKRNGLGINPLFKIASNLFATPVRNSRSTLKKKYSTLRLLSKDKSPKRKISKRATPRTYEKSRMPANLIATPLRNISPNLLVSSKEKPLLIFERPNGSPLMFYDKRGTSVKIYKDGTEIRRAQWATLPPGKYDIVWDNHPNSSISCKGCKYPYPENRTRRS